MSDSGSAAMKPPVPPAPKPAPSVVVLSASPTPDLVSSEAAQAVPDPPALSAPAVAPPTPVNPAAPTATADPAPPDAPILDAPIGDAAPAGAVASQPVVSATTDGPDQVAVFVAPAPPTAPPPVYTPAVQAVRGPAPLAAAPPASRPPSPCSRQHRPHSPAPRDERERSRRRHDSPRRRGSQANWAASRGGMEFVTAAGGTVTGQLPSLLPVAPAPPAAALPQQSLVGPSPSAVVPEASLGQLWRLSEGMWAVHLIQVYGHAALAQGVPLESGHRDECLDAADRLGPCSVGEWPSWRPCWLRPRGVELRALDSLGRQSVVCAGFCAQGLQST
ncbi:unnamed protein product [Closterium sp. Naga37s-1]|nr:unnamed protein product [Closterium sp. Naga37s-1]